MENLYLTILTLAIGTVNAVGGWIITRLSIKVDELTKQTSELNMSLAVLSAQLKERRVINGETKVR